VSPRNRRARRVTVRTVPFPDFSDPCWKFGANHVEIAWSICNAFLGLHP
jgi:hypothetical protein